MLSNAPTLARRLLYIKCKKNRKGEGKMRNLFIIVAILIAGNSYAAAFGDNDPSIYSGCKNYGVNTTFKFSDLLAVMQGFSKSDDSNSGADKNTPSPKGSPAPNDDGGDNFGD